MKEVNMPGVVRDAVCRSFWPLSSVASSSPLEEEEEEEENKKKKEKRSLWQTFLLRYPFVDVGCASLVQP